MPSLQNLKGNNAITSKGDCIITDLPDTDIICVQEVWEKYWAANLIDQLGSKYNQFIYGRLNTLITDTIQCTNLISVCFVYPTDVGDYGIRLNLCLFGKVTLL